MCHQTAIKTRIMARLRHHMAMKISSTNRALKPITTTTTATATCNTGTKREATITSRQLIYSLLCGTILDSQLVQIQSFNPLSSRRTVRLQAFQVANRVHLRRETPRDLLWLTTKTASNHLRKRTNRTPSTTNREVITRCAMREEEATTRMSDPTRKRAYHPA